jgi:hypothetical protein
MHIYQDTAVEEKQTEMFTCMAPVYTDKGQRVTVLKTAPEFRWTAGRIPITLIGKVVVFFREVYLKHKSEAQVRMFFNKAEGWLIQVRPQRVAGASTTEIPGDNTGISPLDPSWVEVGTIHSHANFGAHQSGTDKNNEQHTNGIHITIGDVNTLKLSWHARAYFEGIEHVIDLASWICCVPKGFECLANDALEKLPLLLRGIPADKLAIPQEWLDNIREPAALVNYGVGNFTYPYARTQGLDDETPPVAHRLRPLPAAIPASTTLPAVTTTPPASEPGRTYDSIDFNELMGQALDEAVLVSERSGGKAMADAHSALMTTGEMPENNKYTAKLLFNVYSIFRELSQGVVLEALSECVFARIAK